jgi:type III secretion protein HrpB1
MSKVGCTPETIVEMAATLIEAIRDNRLDEAELLLDQLNEADPSSQEYLIFPVLIAIQRGFFVEALQYLNSLEEGTAPELKALCLYMHNDLSWHQYANIALESPDASTRAAMRQLLQLEPEAEAELAASL